MQIRHFQRVASKQTKETTHDENTARIHDHSSRFIPIPLGLHISDVAMQVVYFPFVLFPHRRQTLLAPFQFLHQPFFDRYLRLQRGQVLAALCCF